MNRDTHYYFGGRGLRESALRYATSRASREPDQVWAVYQGQFATYVRPVSEPVPDETTLLCTAQHVKDDTPYNTVRLLFADGRSEYVNF